MDIKMSHHPGHLGLRPATLDDCLAFSTLTINLPFCIIWIIWILLEVPWEMPSTLFGVNDNWSMGLEISLSPSSLHCEASLLVDVSKVRSGNNLLF